MADVKETRPEAHVPSALEEAETYLTSVRATSLVGSFRYAFIGLAYLFRTQRNARIHVGLTLAVIVAGLLTRLGPVEWAVLTAMMGLIFFAEASNTALEAVVDIASPAYHPLAQIAKDVAAAGVLMAAIASVAVGALIFLSHWIH